MSKSTEESPFEADTGVGAACETTCEKILPDCMEATTYANKQWSTLLPLLLVPSCIANPKSRTNSICESLAKSLSKSLASCVR